MQGVALKMRRSRGEGGVHKRASDGLWIATVTVTGRDGKLRQIRRASKTKAGAIEKLRVLLEERGSGKLVAGTKQFTVEEWLHKWITEIHLNLAPTTKRDYESVIRNYIAPHVGKRKLNKLKPDHVRSMLKALQKEHSSRAAQKAHVVLRRALDDAVRDEEVARNVVRIVPRPGHVKKQRGAYSVDTAHLILRTAVELDAARAHGPYLATRWLTAFQTGARQAEVIGLEWDRVDLGAGVIDISWQLKQQQYAHGCGEPKFNPKLKRDEYPCGRVRVGYCPDRYWDFQPGYEYRDCHKSMVWVRPKTNAGQRYVPMTPALWEALKVYRRERAGDHNPHNLVWHFPDGRPLSQKADNTAWNALLAAAGIEKQPGEFVLHEARNTAATQLLEAGVDAKVIQGILGHANILTTREYQRVGVEFSRSAIAGLSALAPGVPVSEAG